MLADGIDRRRNLHDELLQLQHLVDVAVLGSIVHRHVELREHVGTTIDTTVTTHQHTLARYLLRTYEHGEVLAMLHLVHHRLEIDRIGAGVLEAHHLRVLRNARNGVRSEAHLHVRGHII